MASIKYYASRIQKLISHAGFRYKCPFCSFPASEWMWAGSEIEKDLGVIGGGKRRTLCPKCYSRDRERLMYLFLTETLQIQKYASNLRVLHVAPEIQLFKKLNGIGFAKYVYSDYFEPGYTYPEGTIHMDVTQIEFSDSSFDFILCNHVLEHIPDVKVALSELLRILSPGGRAILQVPISAKNPETIEDPNVIDRNERLQKYGQWDHVRLFGYEDYPKLLRDSGFKLELVPASRDFYRFGVNPKELIYLVTKPNS
jgi:SAM-dependent methyltransferase